MEHTINKNVLDRITAAGLSSLHSHSPFGLLRVFKAVSGTAPHRHSVNLGIKIPSMMGFEKNTTNTSTQVTKSRFKLDGKYYLLNFKSDFPNRKPSCRNKTDSF